MFNLTNYLKLNNFSKIEYVLNDFDLDILDLATILELDPDFVKQVLATGIIPQKLNNELYEEAFEKFYNFLILVNYILKMSNFEFSKFSDILEKSSSFYNSSKKSPPWKNWSIKKYLISNKYSGLIKSIEWIKKY